MKLLRFLAVVAPLFFAALQGVKTQASDVVTPEELFPQLDVILKQAVAQSPAMVSRAVDQEIAENDRIVARAAMLPTVGGYARFFESWDERSDLSERTKFEKVYYDFSITQPIFHWGERRNLDRIGEIRLKLAQRLYRDGYRVLAQEIRGRYLRLIIEKVRAERAAFNATYTADRLKRDEDRLRTKAISEAQIFSTRIAAERAQIYRERTRFELENSKASFARLTGQPPLTDEQIPDAIPEITDQGPALEQLLAGYLSQKDSPTSEAFALRQSLAIERNNLANAKVRLLPKVSLMAGASQDEQSYTVDVANKYQVDSLYAGLMLNWTIFDGFSAGAAKRSAYARLRQLERNYTDLTTRLAETAQQQVKMASFYAREAAINNRLLESAEGFVNTQREAFGRGVISEEDVGSAQLNHMDNRMTAYLSRADYINQVCEFLGTVVEDPVLGNLANQ
jgi:outer membrane protein TolC